MSLRDLSIMTNNVLETDPGLLERFEAHENVVKNSANGLYTYRVSLPFMRSETVGLTRH